MCELFLSFSSRNSPSSSKCSWSRGLNAPSPALSLFAVWLCLWADAASEVAMHMDMHKKICRITRLTCRISYVSSVMCVRFYANAKTIDFSVNKKSLFGNELDILRKLSFILLILSIQRTSLSFLLFVDFFPVENNQLSSKNYVEKNICEIYAVDMRYVA